MRRLLLLGAALWSAGVSAQGSTQGSYCFSKELPKPYVTPAFTGPMTYKVMQAEGKTVLLAEGQIEGGESGRLAAAMAQAGAIEEVWFNSPGGDALEGPAMGRILRKSGAMVRLTQGRACISACSYAFLGGVVRIVDPGGYYGVHMFHSIDSIGTLKLVDRVLSYNTQAKALLDKGQPIDKVRGALVAAVSDDLRGFEQEAAQTAAIRARYLVEMSLSLDFMTDAFGTHSTEVCYLNPQGLTRYNVTNAR